MKYHTLFFSKIRKDVAIFVVCCSRDWCFKVNICLKPVMANEVSMCRFRNLIKKHTRPVRTFE